MNTKELGSVLKNKIFFEYLINKELVGQLNIARDKFP